MYNIAFGALLWLLAPAVLQSSEIPQQKSQSSEKPGKVDNFNFLHLQRSYAKSLLVPFRVLEIPFPEVVCAKDIWGLHASKSATNSLLDSL